MQPQALAQRSLRPTDRRPTRETERHETLLREIADDARGLADRYLRETIVPEGGE